MIGTGMVRRCGDAVSTLSPYLLFISGAKAVVRADDIRKIMGSASEICDHARWRADGRADLDLFRLRGPMRMMARRRR